MNARLAAMLAAVGLLGVAGLWWLAPPPPPVAPPAADGDVPSTDAALDAPTAVAAPDGAPNVLMIVWDTTRADHLGLYGYRRDTTPHIAARADQGVVFDRVVSPAMWTPPSHSSMFTGAAPTHHGVKATYKWLDSHFTTLAEQLGHHGWETWAFSANPYVDPSTNITQGFETVNTTSSQPWRKAAKEATQAKLLPHDASTDISPAWKGKRVIGDVHPFKDAAPVASEALLDWLDARDDDRPWFAFVNMMEAHIPRVPSLASREALLDDALLQRGLTTKVSQTELLAYTFGKHDYSPDELDAIGGVYDAAVRDLDAATGALLDALDRQGVLDHTIVILTADHGENLGDHHMFGHKFSLWDTLLHVPLVVWWPGKLAPRHVTTPVSNLGLFSTVLHLVDVELPTPGPDLDVNLLDVDKPMPVFSELIESTPVSIRRIDKQYGIEDKARWLRTYRSVELDGYKLVVASDLTRELYDLRNDPGETTDLMQADKSRFLALDGLLHDWVASVPAYDPALRVDADHPSGVDSKTRRMLEALGYAEGDEEGDDGDEIEADTDAP
ncbi:MAG: sulfatase [Alphaproteobacteria bacterium]|nr:sulfatase [Alphaproteobacteria bacterium]